MSVNFPPFMAFDVPGCVYNVDLRLFRSSPTVPFRNVLVLSLYEKLRVSSHNNQTDLLGYLSFS